MVFFFSADCLNLVEVCNQFEYFYMKGKLKRDQLPFDKARNWRRNLRKEEAITFNLKIPAIILEKETYKILAGENENRVRIYIGLEKEKEGDKHVLCAYAVSAFLLGSGDVYADYETPVFKLRDKNENLSSEASEVRASIKRYRNWRDGILDDDVEGASVRKYIYPKAYLLTKFELHEIFNIQNKSEAQIEFGISKSMHAMINPVVDENRSEDENSEVFHCSDTCPPACDERSVYNS